MVTFFRSLLGHQADGQGDEEQVQVLQGDVGQVLDVLEPDDPEAEQAEQEQHADQAPGSGTAVSATRAVPA